jgi:diadenosine tetraphosphate (Ap4A) HIT family hydrolase
MEGCVFCEGIEKDRVLFETAQWIAMYDKYPVSKGHVLLIPKEHCETFFDLPEQLTNSIQYWIKHIKDILDDKYHPSGYNIGVNCGKSAGQTVMHCHIHIIPRYDGDVEDPRGGVRGVIPSKQKY